MQKTGKYVAISYKLVRADAVDSLSGEVVLIDSILTDTSITLKQSDIDDYIAAKLSMQQFTDSVQLLTDSDIVAFKALKDSAYHYALLLNNSIVSDNTIEANQQDVNSVYLSMADTDSIPFDSSALVKLYNIAFQCPYSGGHAVYQARSLLALLKDTVYLNDDFCTISYKRNEAEESYQAPKTIKEDNNMLKIAMYPNPTKDYVILSANILTAEKLNLVISDVLGRQVLNMPMIFDNGLYRVNTAGFSNGLYFVNIYNDKNKIFGNKLSILGK